MADAGVIDQDVEPVKLLECRRDRFRISDVDLERKRSAADFFAKASGRLVI